jgi:membrane protein YdbS with pleckstrin-like domain
MGSYIEDHLMEGEKVIFDRRHSLWEIWRNFAVGIGAAAALVLLLTTFKPGKSDVGGYVLLISLVAGFLFLFYGLYPFVKRRFFSEAYRGRDLAVPVVVMVLCLAGWVFFYWFRHSRTFADYWTILACAAFCVLVLATLLYPFLRWYFQHFILTDRRLVLHEGILSKRSMDLPLDQVNDIRLKQNLFERIFRYGDIVIESAGEFGQQPFTNIGRPEEVKRLILHQIRLSALEDDRLRGGETSDRSAEGTGSAAGAPAGSGPARPQEKRPGPDMVESLERLAELRRQGVLSEEEFERAKREILGEDD